MYIVIGRNIENVASFDRTIAVDVRLPLHDDNNTSTAEGRQRLVLLIDGGIIELNTIIYKAFLLNIA